MKKTIVLVVVEVIIFAAILICALNVYGYAFAEDEQWYVMCQPDSYVNIRFAPKKNGQEVGFLELGDSFYTDLEKRNGFIKVMDGFGCKIGWVSLQFVVPDEPVIETVRAWNTTKGRVSCRRSINGTRRKWLKPGAEVTMYAYSEEWAVTNQGFIRINCLEAEH